MSLLAFFRRPGLWLLLPLVLALAARVLVAPGWMIDQDSGGSITVRICSDPANPGAVTTIKIDKTGEHQAAAGQQHCPWGALAASPPIPHASSLAIMRVQPLPAPTPVPSLGFAPGIASSLPPSTGPPIFA